MRVGGFNAAVDPALGNPDYSVVAGVPNVEGANYVTLTTNEMPAHTHVATSTVVDPGHRHVFASDPQIADATYTRYGVLVNGSDSSSGGAEYYTKSELGVNTKASQTTGITVSVPDTDNKGSSQAHSNIPPVMACYYIMHIPTP